VTPLSRPPSRYPAIRVVPALFVASCGAVILALLVALHEYGYL
jgi:hypothetical protein